MIIFVWIAVLSFVGAMSMLLWQVRRLREGYATIQAHQSISAVLEKGGNHVAFHISTFVSQWAKHLALQFLLFTRKLLMIAKYAIIRIEKYFATVIDLVRGKGMDRSHHKRGAVSMFLQEVEQFRVEVRSVEDEK